MKFKNPYEKLEQMTERELLITLCKIADKNRSANASASGWIAFLGILVLIGLILSFLGLGSLVNSFG